jgi:hypothetical protein
MKITFGEDSPGKLMRNRVRAMGTKNKAVSGVKYHLVCALWRIFVMCELPSIYEEES